MSLRRKGNMLAETANNVGDRCAWWFRAHGLPAKEVGRLIGASEGTGKRLRSGVAPTTEQLTKLSRHFGWAFVNFVMEAVIGPSDAVLAAELDDINRCLERLEQNDAVVREDDAAVPHVASASARDAGGLVGRVAHAARRVRR